SPVKEGPLRSWNNGGAGVRLMDQLARGIGKGSRRVGKAMGSVATQALKALRSGLRAKGSGGLEAIVSRIGKAIDRADLGKKAERRLTKHLRGIDKQLTRMGRKYDKAVEKLRNLQQARADMAAGVRDNLR